MKVKDRQDKVRLVFTAEAQIHLAEIPFIRLRGLRAEWLNNGGQHYGKLAMQAQRELVLSESSLELRIELRRRVVSVANCDVRLSRREFFFFVFFAVARKEKWGGGGDGFIQLSEIGRGLLDPVFRRITAAGGRERRLDEFELVAGYDFIGRLLENMERDYEAFRQTLFQVRARINRRLKVAGVREHFLIEARGAYGETGYGLAVVPERIVFC